MTVALVLAALAIVSSSALGPTILAATVARSSGPLNLRIPPPGSSGGINPVGNTTSHIINVPDTGIITDLNVQVRLNHNFDEDIEIRVTGPDTTTVPLSLHNGGNGTDYGSGQNTCDGTFTRFTTFDDEAATAITDGSAPFAGSFRPQQPLTAFDGKSPQGDWTISIRDVAAGDRGVLGCWQLQFTLNDAPTAINDTATTAQGTPVTINVLGNDGDADGTLVPSTATVTSGPARGSASVNPATGAITYTPAAGFAGTDSLTYTVRDNVGGVSNAATVAITVLPNTTTSPAPVVPAAPAAPGTADLRPTKPGKKDKDEQSKPTEEQEQQAQLTNTSNKQDIHTGGEVIVVNQGSDETDLLISIKTIDNEPVIVQVFCPDRRCPNIQVHDIIEVDGEQHGVGDRDTYFVASGGITVKRNCKTIK